MFSAKHSFVDMKECNLNKNKNLPKIGVVCQNAKRSFFGMFLLLFGGFVFCCLCFCLVFCKKAQKGYLPAILELFCLFCSHQRPVWKCFFSSYFVFFAFVFPFKNPFLICFLSINPFLKKILCGVSFLFLLLAFSFPKVCFFSWHKLS